MSRYRSNDFLARPEHFSGAPAGLNHQLPGFHTASNMDQTLAYAQMKTVPSNISGGLVDWPVIVGLDMAGLKPLPDIDGVNLAKGATDIARLLVEESRRAKERGLEESTADLLRAESDYGDYFDDDAGPRNGSDVAIELFRQHASHIERDQRPVLYDRAQTKPAPDAWLRTVARGKISTTDIIAMSGQMRYVQNVGSERIVDVRYMKPFWPELIDTEEDGNTELAEKLEKEGWTVVSLEDAYDGRFSTDTTSAWTSGKKPKRLEYHGTSLNNLISAAPEILMKLPKPPPPFSGRW